MKAPGLRFQIVAGFCLILMLGSVASFLAVFRLAAQVASLDGIQESRSTIEASLEQMRQHSDAETRATIGQETIVQLSRINARNQIAGRNLLIDTLAVFILFLGIQLLALAALALILSRILTRPMQVLLGGIHEASSAGPGYALPRLGGREWASISLAFNQLLHERDQKEALLAEQSRLSGWQEVAAFLAHQLKNPLTSINLALSNLDALESSEDQTLKRESREIIRQESQRLVDLVRRFRASTSLPVPRFGLEILADILTLAQARFTPEQAIFTNSLPTGLSIRADRHLLEEALVNLFTNSVQAWQDAGKAGPVLISLNARGNPATGVVLQVSDSVTGVSPELAETILQMPFSTKAGGSGLGLVFVRSVMNRHHGQLSVGLGSAGGLVFSLNFPREDQPWPAS